MKKIVVIFLFFTILSPVFSQVNLFPAPAKFSKSAGVFNMNKNTVFAGTGQYAEKLAVGLADEVKTLKISGTDIGNNRVRDRKSVV